MTDDTDKLQMFKGSVNTTEALTVSGSPGLEPNTPSPRKRFTRKNKKPTSSYSMFTNFLEQEAQEHAKAQKAVEAKKAAKAQKAAEAKAAAELAAAAPRPKRQRRPRPFYGDEEDATLSRDRAGPGQKGKSPDVQPASGSDAEVSAADQGAAAEPSQDGMTEDSGEAAGGLQETAQPDPNVGSPSEETKKAKKDGRKKRKADKGPAMQAVSGGVSDGKSAAAAASPQEEMGEDVMSEDSKEVTGGLQRGAQPDPNWHIAEAGSAPKEEKRKAKRKNGTRVAYKRSVKELLDDMGVRAQKQTDPDFTGICPHCDGKAKPWRHAARPPYTGKLVCSACGVWERRHPNQSLLEKPPKVGKRGKNSEVQDVQENDDGAALQPDHMAGMDDLAQAALAAASSGIDQLAHIAHVAQMPQPAHNGPALAAASNSVAMPLSQLTAVIALLAAKHAFLQQEVQSIAEDAMVAGQQLPGGEQGHAQAATSNDVQGSAHSCSASSAHQPSATMSAPAQVAAGTTAEHAKVQSAEGGAAVVAQEATGGQQQSTVAIVLRGVQTGDEGGSMGGEGGVRNGAAHAAAQEAMSGDGAAQQSAAEAIDPMTAEQQATGAGVWRGLPRAAGNNAAGAAILAQHAAVEASAALHDTQRTKRAADEGEDVYSKRRKANDNSTLKAGSNDSAADSMQLDTNAHADISMRRTVRRRAL